MNDRPPVLLILDKMLKAGTQRHILHVLEGLGNEYQFHVVSLEGRGPWDDEVRRRGGILHVYGLTRLYGPSGWQALYGLTGLIRELNPVGIESFMFTAHVATAWSNRRAGNVPFISSRREKTLWRKPWHLALRRWANRSVARHLANSKAVADDVVRCEGVDLKNVPVIENGLDVRGYELEGPVLTEGKGCHAVVLAALKPVKQHRLLLEALALAKNELGDLSVHFIGEGPLRAELEQRTAELDLQRHVRFVGEIDPVLPVLKHYDFAILPSKSEGSSNSLIECLGAGMPAVVFDVDGNREVVVDNENGFLVESGDPIALGQVIARLATDDALRDRLGRVACEEVRKRYSVETMCLLKRQHYKDVFQC